MALCWLLCCWQHSHTHLKVKVWPAVLQKNVGGNKKSEVERKRKWGKESPIKTQEERVGPECPRASNTAILSNPAGVTEICTRCPLVVVQGIGRQQIVLLFWTVTKSTLGGWRAGGGVSWNVVCQRNNVLVLGVHLSLLVWLRCQKIFN